MRRWALLAAAALAGCASPVVAPMGPPVGPPRLEADRILAADGAELPLKRWLPEGRPRAVILALHGFNDYSNAFALPAEAWAEAGIATYAYDQRGFGAAPNRGLWPGTETLVADLELAALLVGRRHPGVKLFLLGESMGAAVILAAGAGGEAGAILVAPAVRGREALNPLGRALLWLGAHTVPGLAGQPVNVGIRASDNLAMLRALAKDPLVIKETRIDAVWGLVSLMDEALAAAPRFEREALILLGANDQLIPDRPNRLMLERLPVVPAGRRQVVVYERGYHMLLRDLGRARVHADVARWVLARAAGPTANLIGGPDSDTVARSRP
ncbi:MAG: alpha/beta fold hydrolase [Pseudomonadota bacterium]